MKKNLAELAENEQFRCHLSSAAVVGITDGEPVVAVPDHLRRLLRGKTHRGSGHYTFRKLFAAGFEFSMSINDMADRIVARFKHVNEFPSGTGRSI